MMKDDIQYDVVIVGAGVSGLTAAYNIRKRNESLKLIVLESKDRVGGRTQTVPLACASGTDYWDVGGQWVGRSQPHVISLLKELGLKTYPQYLTGTKLQQIGKGKVRSYNSNIPNLSFFSLLDLQALMMKMDHYQKQLSAENPSSHPKAAQWDSMSLAKYLDQTLFTKEARLVTEAAMRSVLGCETSHVSFLYYLLYIRMAGTLKDLIEATENAAQEWKIAGGAQGISYKLRELIGEDVVQVNEAVTKVTQTSDAVIVRTSSGWTGTAARVIFATPPKALEHIEFSPRLPDDRIELTKKMPMGNMIKVIITYEKAFWRERNLSGEVVSDGGESTVPGCSMGPMCLTFDATSGNGNAALVAFVGGQAAVEWAMQSAKVRQKAVLDHLAVFFGVEIYSFLDYVEKDWNHEPFSWGGPVSYIVPGGMNNFERAIRRPAGRLHFAGTETATKWSGYISGAVQAGERSALEVLAELHPSSLSISDQQLLEESSIQILKTGKSKVLKERHLEGFLSFGIGLSLATVVALMVLRWVRNGDDANFPLNLSMLNFFK